MNTTAPLPALKHWRLETDSDNIVWLIFDHAEEKVNILGQPVLTELDQIVTHLEGLKPKPAGLVLVSGKSGSFIAGADIREFGQSTDQKQVADGIRQVHGLFARIEKLPFIKVVAFEGFCLGGGLELALCFDWRIALDADHTRIGFPEVKLGIYPGFGGSGRSIRVMGATGAMEIMLSGRMLRARAARSMGLVDQLVGPHGSLRWAARQAVFKNRKHSGPGAVATLAALGPARKILAGMMRKQVARRASREHYPAPYALIDAFEKHGNHPQSMINAEAENVARLVTGETSTNLRRVFGLTELLKAQGKKSDFKARRVHVIGAGVMGGDIAAWCALRGLEVTLQDREMKYIEPALKRAAGLFKKRLRQPERVAAAKTRLIADPEGKGAARADVIIEVIFEDRDAKRALFEGLNGRIRDDAVVATNTSAIPLAELASALDRPERLIGLHFFNPVAQMPLVEVVFDANSDSQCVADGSSFATQIGKYALPVTSTPGFLVNRVLAPYMQKAMALYRGGTPKEALDKAATKFGMPMGPVELVDIVGLDVALGVTKTLGSQADAEDIGFLQSMVDAGKLGKKSGQGFYRWEKGKPQKDPKAALGHDLDALARELMQPYLDECRACLADGVVENADLLDAGMVFGTGFAPFRGGPMNYLETQGQEQAHA